MNDYINKVKPKEDLKDNNTIINDFDMNFMTKKFLT